MVEKIPMTRRLETNVQFFGRFTWKDLIRLCLPVALALLVAPPIERNHIMWLITVGIGGWLGVIWYGIRPNGYTLDYQLYHLIRWFLSGSN
ncbi:hypothetical protein [Haloferax gibbonsii]|uniref:hypothetical protein n=1 Tax=Haloferax gibbonsii TaxID=35746 RepID=UPI001EF9E444|nr:hypothetical protein [Haloferax gibbonsii]